MTLPGGKAMYCWTFPPFEIVVVWAATPVLSGLHQLIEEHQWIHYGIVDRIPELQPELFRVARREWYAVLPHVVEDLQPHAPEQLAALHAVSDVSSFMAAFKQDFTALKGLARSRLLSSAEIARRALHAQLTVLASVEHRGSAASRSSNEDKPPWNPSSLRAARQLHPLVRRPAQSCPITKSSTMAFASEEHRPRDARSPPCVRYLCGLCPRETT